MSNKGYIYTIVSLLFGLLLLSVISLQYQTIKTTAELEPSKVRTDELHFFVESAKKDMTRAMAISGRKAAAYLVGYMVTPTNNSGQRVYPNAPLALANMIMNATVINTSNPTQNFTILQMQNDTMTGWLRKVNETGEELHFDVNITPLSIEIYPYDESHFLEIFNLSFDISDRKGLNKAEMCRYKNNNTQIYVLVSFDELEDPMYASRTNNYVKRFMNFGTNTYSDNNASVYEILGYGTRGNGTGGGKILDLQLITSAANLEINITNFSNTTPQSIQTVEYTVFVFNVSSSTLNSLNDQAKEILNRAGGVINYNSTFTPPAGMNFPYVSNLSYINFTNKQHVVLRNGLNHTVEYLYINDDIINKSYYVNANNTGPSFFDRLDRNLTVSEHYLNDTIKARTLLGVDPNTKIGIESFVNVTEFANYTLYTNGLLDPFVGQSSADFMYFNNSAGYRIYGTPEWFRLDAQHIKDYYLTQLVYDRAYAGVWHFDEEKTGTPSTYDYSRVPSTPINVPMNPWNAGKHFNGLFLTGAPGEYISIKHSNQLNITGPITITAWINLTNSGSIRPIVSKSTGPQNTPDSYMLYIDDSELNFAVGNGTAAAGRTVSYNIPLPILNNWYFVAGTWDNTTAKLYVNGTLVSSAAISREMSSNAGDMYIGRDALASNYFIGTIDELKIYNRSLSESEIMDAYIMMR
jgi:hypothetical protein